MHWAITAKLIETCRLNGTVPQFYLADVMARIVRGHPNSQIDDLLPRAYAPSPELVARDVKTGVPRDPLVLRFEGDSLEGGPKPSPTTPGPRQRSGSYSERQLAEPSVENG